MVDLEYDPTSLLQPCPPERFQVFEQWLCGYWETEVRLPKAYTNHLQRYHGGCPGKACFRTPCGATRMVGRFFNFLKRGDVPPPLTPTWRQWSGEPDVRLDYRIEGFLDYEYWCLRLDGARNCLPIAGLDKAGHNCRDMDDMDLLCLDYNAGGEPAVVAWAFPGFDPVVPVAQSFEAFLDLLFHCPEGVVRWPAGNW